MTIKLERYCLRIFCLLGINIVNNSKLVAGSTFISFSLRMACNNGQRRPICVVYIQDWPIL